MNGVTFEASLKVNRSPSKKPMSTPSNSNLRQSDTRARNGSMLSRMPTMSQQEDEEMQGNFHRHNQ
jgi:hypothetical protein